MWDFSSISLSSYSESFLLLSIGLPLETKRETEIYTKGKIYPNSKIVLGDKPITIIFEQLFIFSIVCV